MGSSTSKGAHGFREMSSKTKDLHGMGHDDDNLDLKPHSSSSSQPQPTPKWWKLRYRNNHGNKSKSLPNSSDSLILFKEYLNSLNNATLIKLLHVYNKSEYEYIEWRKCESSRFIGNTIEQDLENLLDYKYNCDITLNINSVASFPAHISILKQRSSYFRALLFNCEERYSQVGYCGSKDASSSKDNRGYHYREKDPSHDYLRGKESSSDEYNSYHRNKDIKLPYERKLLSVDLNVGSTNIYKLLRYLYTGINEEQCKEATGNSSSCHRTDENDIAIGVNSGKNPLKMDLSEMLINGSYTDLILIWRCSKLNSEYVYPCHKSILSARSPFFRNLLSRSMHQNELEIDENIIQKKYALLLLTCLYTDVLDLKLIGKYTLEQVIGEDRKDELDITDGNYKAYFEIITQIYQIGRFLEFDLLCNQCEDLVINNILNNCDPTNSVDANIVLKVLKWSTEAFGSKYVHRQCIQYILFNYNEFVKNNSLLQSVDEETIETLISSNYLQASECEILGSIMLWCNLQINSSSAVSNTGESACQRGFQRMERNAKLNQLLRPFVKWIRFEQILNRSVLNQCLINNLFGSMGESIVSSEMILNFITRPRYVQSFHNEIISTFYSKQSSFVPSSSGSAPTSCIPDTLYMLDGSGSSSHGAAGVSPGTSQGLHNNIVIEPELLAAMKQRENKLCSQNKQMEMTPCLLQYIRLRIVREFGFPDSAVQILNGLNKCEENWNDTSPSTSLSNRMPDVVDASSNSATLLPVKESSSGTSKSGKAGSQSQQQRETLEQGLIDLDLGDGVNIANHSVGTLPCGVDSSSSGKLSHFRVDICPSTGGRERGERERDDMRRSDKSRIPRFL